MFGLFSIKLASDVLKGLSSRLGMALIAAALAFGAGYQTAHNSAETNTLRTELAAARKDLGITQAANILARTQQAAVEASLTSAQEAYNDLLKRPPSRRCPARADDVERLLRIR